MPVTFPSIEFLQALMSEAAEGAEALASLGDEEILFAIDVDGRMFVIEFADRACVAVALSGNPNDMDFVLTGSQASWLDLLAVAVDEEKFRSLLRVGGPVEPVCAEEEEGLQRFELAFSALRTFFSGARSFDWSAS
jgi:hypothetical protein